MAMYKGGGDVHRAVKEKSMHTKVMRKKGGRTEADESSSKEDKEYGGGYELPEDDVTTSYSGKSNVTDEAKGEMKKGGRAAKKKGGEVKKEKKVHKVEGDEKGARMDRPARKRGGGIGADVNPLSTAATLKDRRGPSPGDDARGITGTER